MKEYGGYIELDTYRLPMLHEGAIPLNCGRNCLAYIIEARKIKKLLLPYFMCDSVFELCKKYGVKISFYHVNEKFIPQNVTLESDTWLYVMNYYGQLDSEYLSAIKAKYERVIVDNAQAYFQMPVEKVDTLYTCRKFFGVADGAFLYTDAIIGEDLSIDESFERMHYLLGRFERTASEFYSEYVSNNHLFSDEPVKRMSKLTNNLLHAIDYEFVKKRRTENFKVYHKLLGDMNDLKLCIPEGAFAYPFLTENGAEIRRVLQKKKIYIPTLWPNVMEDTDKFSVEYNFAENILPLPCDQRYGIDEILYIKKIIEEALK